MNVERFSNFIFIFTKNEYTLILISDQSWYDIFIINKFSLFVIIK